MAAVVEKHSDVAAEVKMRRTLHAGSFLVLEGSDLSHPLVFSRN